MRRARARRLAEDAYRNLLRLGAVGFASTTGVLLADVLYASGERDEAERTAIEGENLGGSEDVVNFAIGRGVRARVAADRGDLAAADELAREAVHYSPETDFPLMHGDAYRTLAYVHHAAGRPDDEREALERALVAYRRKEIVPLIRETERLLEAIRPPRG